MTQNPFASSPYTLNVLSSLTHLPEDEVEQLIQHEGSTYYHSDEDSHVGWLPTLQRPFHITEELAPILENRVRVGSAGLRTVLDESVFIISSVDRRTPTSSVFFSRFWADTVLEEHGVEVGDTNFLVLLPSNPQKATYCGHADVILRLADRASHYTIATPEALLSGGVAQHRKGN